MAKSFLRQARVMAKTRQAFDLDNGSGTTIDETLFNSGPRGARLVRVYALYEVTAGTVASGNFKLGVAAGGATLVAATAYTDSAAAGDVTEAAIVLDAIPPNTTVFVRHTGVGATQAGSAYVIAEFVYDE
jgi:hypothetical protein